MKKWWIHLPHWSKKLLALGVPTVLVLFMAVSSVIGWLAAGKALAVSPQQVVYDQTIAAVQGNSYTISGSAYNVDGIIGGIRTDGSMIGIFSAPVRKDDAAKTSTRTLDTTMGEPLKVGDKLSLQGNIWTTNPKVALGLDYKDITYQSPLGTMGAWLTSPSNQASQPVQTETKASTKWTIGVHGVNANKTEMLRFIKPVIAAHNTMMVINYRNDVNNPQSGDGYNHLGDTEWQDLQAAVQYARAHGATDIRLYGDSLGGSTVENYLRRSPDVATANISRVILDSPALDWNEINRAQLTQSGYPGFLSFFTDIAINVRAGVSLSRISTNASDIQQKTLIFHNADDHTVPQAASKRLAAARPDLVTLQDFGSGGHLRAWNHDQTRYEQLVTSFLAE
jgi:hypothetical protein